VIDCEEVVDWEADTEELGLCVTDGDVDNDGEGVAERVALALLDAICVEEPLELAVAGIELDIDCDEEAEIVGLWLEVLVNVGDALGAQYSF
jgi:hypothetical protein